MKLGDLNTGILRRAVKAYASEAYGRRRRPPPIKDALAIEGHGFVDILRGMTDETNKGEDAHQRRYILRLGNPNYPHMKLVIAEVLFDGEFFFLVDPHDEIELDPSWPDYEDWQELRRYNHELKRRIERRWAREGIPTVQDLHDAAAEDVGRPDVELRAGKVLVAIDDAPGSETMAMTLASRGYDAFEAGGNDLGPEELLEIAEQSGADVVFLGTMVWGRNGRRFACELARRLADRDADRSPSILLVRKSNDHRDRPEGVGAVVPVPFDCEQILEALGKLLA